MDSTQIISAFVTLFVVIDPIGLAPLFIALTREMEPAHRRRIGWRALAIAAVLLTLFGLAGESILKGIGISLPAFRIAGGILLFLTALDMLFERRTERREGQARDDDHDPSVFPLATPLLAGPGALATMILLVGQNESPAHTLMIHLVMLVVLGICAALFAIAGPLAQLLGKTGTMVVTRLFGMLLAALSIQFVIDGLDGSGLL
ncbi:MULTISPECIES: MarC family protein [unclassified Paracoccus (in: a-proteobacteria)]|uniref:MarC family protein n=1 Tax=unclassified Paracoccus (in: a-proteobacteria) TaxID=2688777 RepID=UPI0012B439D3|nr:MULTISPECIES: MarC family protein [unclassified Paracoccus (in: a-proteobacteria)]UXU73755.1 MarC family protein [Paracoccus sp. SMMA_5]UXU79645.1 MarC family protein [Paracoccus sp. SMMA_5_TC]